MPVDIQKLADEVLQHVEASIKTASATQDIRSQLNTEVGSLLSKVAADLRNIDDQNPTHKDLIAIKTAQTVVQTKEATAPTPENGSTQGNYFRKLAQQIRETGKQNEEIRLTKTAKLVNAAVALQHLTGN